ncbi:hypothetical protein RhiirC2_80811 [Rhizophagus irregularis]|uniref:Uncharacterized protein n=1 Tax=Rhizophagus irregularis TaxID=588596 RepID=A0A2N1MTV0_9GLOM|nr:hypothetical protein RhiirC2_80811 [Rhizophagus irregularis]
MLETYVRTKRIEVRPNLYYHTVLLNLIPVYFYYLIVHYIFTVKIFYFQFTFFLNVR